MLIPYIHLCILLPVPILYRPIQEYLSCLYRYPVIPNYSRWYVGDFWTLLALFYFIHVAHCKGENMRFPPVQYCTVLCIISYRTYARTYGQRSHLLREATRKFSAKRQNLSRSCRYLQQPRLDAGKKLLDGLHLKKGFIELFGSWKMLPRINFSISWRASESGDENNKKNKTVIIVVGILMAMQGTLYLCRLQECDHFTWRQ